MKKWTKRVILSLACVSVVALVVLLCVPPAPRLTYENIAKLDFSSTEADAIELFGRPYFKGPLENGGQNVVWIEDQLLFGVRLNERGKVIDIRWLEKNANEDFWHKLRRRLRL